eukprot:1883381-Amphidinium_carterae.1
MGAIVSKHGVKCDCKDGCHGAVSVSCDLCASPCHLLYADTGTILWLSDGDASESPMPYEYTTVTCVFSLDVHTAVLLIFAFLTRAHFFQVCLCVICQPSLAHMRLRGGALSFAMQPQLSPMAYG